MDKEKLFELLEHSERLPMLPQNISGIFALLRDPAQTDIDSLADAVSQTEPLYEMILSNLNSGYYQLSKPVTSIRDAVAYLGMHTVQNLLIYFMSRQLFPDHPRTEKSRTFDMPRYWRHVFGTSLAAGKLCVRHRLGDKHKLFSYGLIHDIGIALIDACLPGLLDDVTDKVLGGIHQLAAERAVFGGLTHAEVGAWLCRRWGLPDDITSIVQYHHAPLFAKTHAQEVRLMHVADVISTEYYEKLLGVSLSHSISAQIMSSLGITEENRQEVIDELPTEVERIRSYFVL